MTSPSAAPTADLAALLDDGGLVLPAGDVPRAALALARDLEPDHLLHHSVRSWVYARVAAGARGWRVTTDFDDTALFVACVLHDTGLHAPARGDRRFEVEGADLARSFALAQGLPRATADTVWDAVALHTSVGIAEHKQAEVALARAGIAMDFGLDAHSVPDDLAAAVDVELPRLGLTPRLVDAIVADAAGSEGRAPAPSLAWLLVQERREPPHVTGMERRAAASRWGL